MNGDDEQSGPLASDFNPQWMEDGGGVNGGESTEPRFDDYNSYQDQAFTQYYPNEDAWRRARRRRDPGSRRQWNTNVFSRQNQTQNTGCGGS